MHPHRLIPRRRLQTLGIALGLAACSGGVAAEIDLQRLPPPAAEPVDYDRDIRPIFETACLRCHGPERPKSGFRLDNRESALKGGQIGISIRPGDSTNSPLIHYVARLVADLEMPPAGKGEPLTSEQIGQLRAWIDQGANYPSGAVEARGASWLVATPAVRFISVSGNERKFREHGWVPEGWSGGLEQFAWQENLDADRTFAAEGRVLVDAHDYRVKLSFEDRQLGFVRAGFEQYRKWTDDHGGEYPPFAIPTPALDQDLVLDLGRAWFEVGLAKPGLPRLTLGYEYQFKEGDKSTLQWGYVTQPDTFETRAIYPNAQSLDSQVHVLKFDFAYELWGIGIEDNFRGEFSDTTARRLNVESYTIGDALPFLARQHQEDTSQFLGANALRLEKRLHDWLLLSGGYLYSKLDGDAGFSMELFSPQDPAAAPFAWLTSPNIVLRQEAHVFNANVQVQPWNHLSLNAGVQPDWTRQEGFGQAIFNGYTTPYSANLDRQAVDETVGLRFTAVPFTVINAEARLRQEAIGQFEERSIDDGFDDASDFMRDTDANANLAEFRAGITVSPWSQVSFSGGYRHRAQQTDYDPLTDHDLSPTPGNGYPAFITNRDLDTDEFTAKLAWHPCRWLKTSVTYSRVSTAFRSTTQDFINPIDAIPFLGGTLRAGNYDANYYGLGLTLAPWRRLFLNATLLYGDSQTETAVETGGAVVPYAGDTYTLLSTATYALTQTTDLQANYSFSNADYAQDNEVAGLPLGIVYDRHALIAGITRRFKGNLTASLQYGFFLYHEPTAGGANDYAAHALFASVSKRLP